ncbi:hypothetical protein G9A89_013989 [Geosiphon pyriformis]|nr:hypothetical protein G9A89_013989 [Geosiphon pyriformis]
MPDSIYVIWKTNPQHYHSESYKKKISIQEGVIDSGYTGNLMVLLQNNSEKSYTIESKEKIAQAIFLPLVKIGKFVPVKNCEKLLQTIRGTFGFGSTEKEIEANFTKTIEEKGKVIKTETNLVQHQIPTGDTKPEKQCTYHVPPMEHNFIRKEVQSMLEKGIIQLSMSPWSLPVV